VHPAERPQNLLLTKLKPVIQPDLFSA
jgi:hypothetical protein